MLWATGGLEKGFWEVHTLGRWALCLKFSSLPEVFQGPVRCGTLDPIRQEELCGLEGVAAFAESACVLSADIVNADKMSGRSRKYKIIFSPQKVSLTALCCSYPTALCLPALRAFHQKCLIKIKRRDAWE